MAPAARGGGAKIIYALIPQILLSPRYQDHARRERCYRPDWWHQCLAMVWTQLLNQALVCYRGDGMWPAAIRKQDELAYEVVPPGFVPSDEIGGFRLKLPR